MISDLETLLSKLANSTKVIRTSDELWMDAPKLGVVQMGASLLELGARLSTMTGTALEDGETELIYHFVFGSTAINIKVRTQKGTIPSITPITPSANWIEREIHDLYAVEFIGHPYLERFIRPPELSIGFFREAGGEVGKQRREQAQKSAS